MAFPSKQYGLLLPQKKGTSNPILQRPSVFGDDSDDETSVGESLQKEAVKKRMMKQTRLEMHKALEQDSTVYDYDAVYEDIQQQRLESSKKVLGGADKKPKYINQLMKAVEDRKKEQERRDDRKIQKEREAEGEQYADKEAYVTSAYRQKLQERKEELEREKREAAMEAALDVKKQKDLSGFYRHLLNQTVGEEEIPDRSVEKNQSSKAADVTERTSPLPSPTLPASGDHGPSSHSDSEEGHDQKSAFSKPGAAVTHTKRHYRQRSPASGSGEDEDKERERDREKRSHRDRERDRGRDKNRERDRDRQRERDRERDDRHGARRDDKDRRKERERERDREDDRSRGRKEVEREDRHGRRERSPKERERGKDGEREKRRDSEEDKGKGKESDKAKESRKDLEKEKTTPTDTKKVDLEKEKTTPTDTKKIEAAGEGEKKGEEDSVEKGEKKGEEDSVEKGEKKGEEDSVEKGEKKGEEDSVEKERVEEEEKVNKFAKRSSDHTVSSARERYLARQMSRAGSKTYIEKEED